MQLRSPQSRGRLPGPAIQRVLTWLFPSLPQSSHSLSPGSLPSFQLCHFKDARAKGVDQRSEQGGASNQTGSELQGGGRPQRDAGGGESAILCSLVESKQVGTAGSSNRGPGGRG